MHIHGNPLSSHLTSSLPTLATQQAMTAKRLAADVRRKLSRVAVTGDEEGTSPIEERGEADPDQKRSPQHEDETFRSLLVSVSA